MIKKELTGNAITPGPSINVGIVRLPWQWVLAGLLLVALLVRMAALFSFRSSLYFDFMLWDERYYHNWARAILDGTYQSSTVYEFAPLPAYLMALVYKVLSPQIVYVRYLNVAVGTATCFLVYLIGRELAGRRVGLWACLVAALYQPFVFYSVVPLKTALGVCLFAGMLYLFVSAVRTGSALRWAGVGVALALTVLVRPNTMLLLPLFPVVMVAGHFKHDTPWKRVLLSGGAYTVGLIIVLSPVAVRNYRVAGEMTITASQAGFNLYLSNRPGNKDPYYRPLPFASSSPFHQGVQCTIEASRRAGRKLTDKEASAYLANEVLAWATTSPGTFSRHLLEKFLAFFNRFEYGDHYDIGFTSRFVPFFRLPLPVLGLILPFGLTGMLLTWRQSRQHAGLAAIFFTYAAGLIIFFTSTRMRLPLATILIPFAVIAFRDMLFCIRDREGRRLAACGALLATFAVLEVLPVRAAGDMTAYYNTHAVMLNQRGDSQTAEKYWLASSTMRGSFSAFADLSLAGQALRRAEYARARSFLANIADTSFAAFAKYELLGDMALQQAQKAEAVGAYEASLQLNSGQKRVQKKLYQLLWNLDREKALIAYEQYRYILSFYPGNRDG